MALQDLRDTTGIVASSRGEQRFGRARGFAEALPPTLRHLFVAAHSRHRFPPELAFLVAEGVTPEKLLPIEQAATYAGVTGEAALFGTGVSDDLYYRMLARHLGAPYLETPLPLAGGTDIAKASAAGVAELAPNAERLRSVRAPRGEALRRLLREADRLDGAFAITTPRRLDALLRRHDGAGPRSRAADGLADWDASLSARGGPARWQRRLALLTLMLAAFGAVTYPGPTLTAMFLLLFPLFAAAVIQRLIVVAASPVPNGREPEASADCDLPVYTLLVPLFRETRVLAQLVEALDAIDYPAAKLDIKILLEAQDREMIAAVSRRFLPDRYDVMVLEDGHPRTKPRALNAGLEWARGDYVVVYDAEDRPDPGQLRAAARRFAAAPKNLACLQARLVIDPADQSWLTKLFALEYAALFGVVKPGLAALGLPVPLGGTSNHFRIEALRHVGGWDAWNVTEDIDLGFRLARFGFAVEALDSATREEAPTTVARWMPQRARWLKGWMVTLAVCCRDPLRLRRDLGLGHALSIVVMLGATVVSALVGPPLLLFALVQVSHATSLRAGTPINVACVLAWVLLLAAGLVAMLWPIVVGLRRVGRLDLAPWAFLMPVYLLLTVFAAFRALYEAWRDPQRWNKTEHGLAERRSGPPPPMRPQRRSSR